MPIVDGLSATKMIRSHEKVHPSHWLSTKASLNGRVPIIAVSATLVEQDRQTYIDAGFDGWILKPIHFDRLSELMRGIVDGSVRTKCLYQRGQWEQGGWFHDGNWSMFKANTTPAQGEVPFSDSQKISEAKEAEQTRIDQASEKNESQDQRGKSS